jgi:hypothetical protein
MFGGWSGILAGAAAEVALLIGIMAVVQGCVLLGPPETYTDMELRIDEVTRSLPEAYVQVASGRDGSRLGFAGPPPEVDRIFGAPWDGGTMCETAERLVRSFGSPHDFHDDGCHFSVPIESGWRARIPASLGISPKIQSTHQRPRPTGRSNGIARRSVPTRRGFVAPSRPLSYASIPTSLEGETGVQNDSDGEKNVGE